MNQKTQNWPKRAGQLVSHLKADLRNAQMLKDPWKRAVHSMVVGWQIRISRPTAKGNVKQTPRPTWRVFAHLGVGILLTKKSHANRSDWKLWATRRVSGGERYIPKAKRTWQSSPGQPAM